MSEEYTYFKLKFHTKRYRRLLDSIREQADGESMNLALRDKIIIWDYNERQQSLPQQGQESGETHTNLPQLGQKQPVPEDDLSAALDDIAAAFDE